jgi:hypothetical protein
MFRPRPFWLTLRKKNNFVEWFLNFFRHTEYPTAFNPKK